MTVSHGGLRDSSGEHWRHAYCSMTALKPLATDRICRVNNELQTFSKAAGVVSEVPRELFI
jgi:hypothetical protein